MAILFSDKKSSKKGAYMFRLFITTISMVSAMSFSETISAAPEELPIKPKVIYGNDDRRDLYQITDSAWKTLADSTVALVNASNIQTDPSQNQFKLKGPKFGEKRQLCRSERFFEQQSSSFCSGFLVAPDIIATAGHCVKSQIDCNNTRFVFGFSIYSEGSIPTNIPAHEVYACSELLGQELNDQGADWALVRLNRPVAGHAPLSVNLQGNIIKDAPLVVIGHPSGLATKLAGGANVRDASHAEYFVANADSYGGNSGSAVFNAETGLVEGILVRGTSDFIYDVAKKCYVSRICAPNECRGEDATKMSAVKGLLNINIVKEYP